jgi:hypothetical protein
MKMLLEIWCWSYGAGLWALAHKTPLAIIITLCFLVRMTRPRPKPVEVLPVERVTEWQTCW